MPEGDTVLKVALALKPYLVGNEVTRLWLFDREEADWIVGTTVTAVETRGKHMIMVFSGHEDGDWALRVHLGMHGAWRWYREPRPEGSKAMPWGDARVLISVTGDASPDLSRLPAITYMCFNPAQVELTRKGKLRGHPKLRRLGPDLLAPDVSYEEVLRRAKSPDQQGRAIGEVLLDQTVAAGIGNVFRSELLFLDRLWPETTTAKLSDARLLGLFRNASRLLHQSVDLGSRVTTTETRPGPGPNLYVYARSGKPCLECATTIAFKRTGDLARPLYYCPACQLE